MGKSKVLDRSLGFILPIILFVIWEIVSRLELFPVQLIVPPKQVMITFLDLLKQGEIVGNLKISLLRVIAGFLLGVTAGFALGTAMGLSKTIEEYVAPFFHSVRQIPLLAWMPLLMIWCGIGELFKIVFISFGAFYPMTLNTFDGIRGVPKEYVEVGRVFGYNRFKLWQKVILPAAMPDILTGLRFGLSISWMMVVGAELMASTSGIGYMMVWGRQLFQLDIVMVGIIIIGIIGLILDQALKLAESFFLRWRK